MPTINDSPIEALPDLSMLENLVTLQLCNKIL
jgi:hypothetical protein